MKYHLHNWTFLPIYRSHTILPLIIGSVNVCILKTIVCLYMNLGHLDNSKVKSYANFSIGET